MNFASLSPVKTSITPAKILPHVTQIPGLLLTQFEVDMVDSIIYVSQLEGDWMCNVGVIELGQAVPNPEVFACIFIDEKIGLASIHLTRDFIERLYIHQREAELAEIHATQKIRDADWLKQVNESWRSRFWRRLKML